VCRWLAASICKPAAPPPQCGPAHRAALLVWGEVAPLVEVCNSAYFVQKAMD
jgi:hypothetical protein